MPRSSRSAAAVWAPLALAAVTSIVWLGWTSSPRDVVRAQGSSPLWIVPEEQAPGEASPIARAIAALTDDRPEDALAALELADDTLLAGYALLYRGRAELALDRPTAAAATAMELIGTDPRGHLGEAAGWLAIEAAEELEDWDTVARVAQALTADPHLAHPARAQLRLGLASLERGNRDRAVAAFDRTRFDHPLTAEAREASTHLSTLLGPRLFARERYAEEFARAKQLYGAGRYSEARDAFGGLQGLARGDDRDLIELRIAACDFHLGQVTAARTAVNAYVHGNDTPARVPEARYYFLSAQRLLGQRSDYIERTADFIERYPDSEFAPRVLDELGTHYILADEDAKAAATFLDLYRRYPTSEYGARAAWKSGWWDYKQGEYGRAIQTFESAFDRFDSSNYRPSWLYWIARAHRHLGDRAVAEAGFERVVRFYRNSYYGREAMRALEDLRAAGRPAPGLPVAPASLDLPPTIVPGDPPPDAEFIRRMLGQGLYADAIGELRRHQRASGSTPVVEATIAWALARNGELRPSINAMRRAYPEFMAAGGEALPDEVLRTIFPVDHWDLISTYAASHGLDPFLMTALVAQESTFQADVRSSANAYGLMQIIPGTGRRLARTLGIGPFRTSLLVDPEVNVRMGMRYFADLLAEFADPAPTLASYNAGEHRVRVWLRERPGMARDEFIDDIPFPETQNYVKRILGTVEDYRLLYPHLSPAHAQRSGQ